MSTEDELSVARAYHAGYEDGYAHAVGVCFGDNPPWREYDILEDQDAYDQGRIDGYDDVDD